MICKIFLTSVCLLLLLIRYSECKGNKNFTTVSTENIYEYSFANELLDYCLNESKVTIFFTNESFEDNILLKYLYERHNLIYLFTVNADNFLKMHMRNRHIYFLDDTNIKPENFPVTTAILSISSPIHFNKTLEDLRNSVWWNPEAYFIIVNSDISNSCNMAEIFLRIAWTYKILSTLYLCKNHNDKLFIYTYNPYSDLAPMLWTEVQTNASSDLRWTLFQISWHTIADLQIYNWDIVCRILFFDKTQNLNGYNLKVAYSNWDPYYHFMQNKKGYDCFVGLDFQIIRSVLDHMNATVTAKLFPSIAFFDNDKQLIGIGRDVMFSIVDFSINLYFLRDYWRQQVTSVFFTASLKIVTLETPTFHQGNLNIAASFQTWAFFVIICIMFTFILKILLNVSMTLAGLEFFRIIVQASTLQMPNTLLRRILFIIFLTANFTFSSYIQSFLLAETTSSNQFFAIDKIDELINSNRSIHAFATHNTLISQDEIKNRYQALPVPNHNFEELVRSENTACICTKEYLGYHIKNWSLIHISKESLAERILTYSFAEDSPFLQKCSLLLSKLCESGITSYILKREQMLRMKNSLTEEVTTAMIGMDNLMIIFRLIVGIWVLGIFSLCCEVLIYRFKTKDNR